MAVVPSPQPRSRTLWPREMPIRSTSASPLSRMLWAMRVKSPFSHRAWFGLIGGIVIRSFPLVARVILGIDVLYRPRSLAMKLNHGLPLDPHEMLHAGFPVA